MTTSGKEKAEQGSTSKQSNIVRCIRRHKIIRLTEANYCQDINRSGLLFFVCFSCWILRVTLSSYCYCRHGTKESETDLRDGMGEERDGTDEEEPQL